MTAPSQLEALRDARDVAARRGPVSDDLRRILETREARAVLDRCGERLAVPDHRPYPLAAYTLDRAPSSIAVGDAAVLLSYADAAARDAYAIGPADPAPRRGEPWIAANRSWVPTARCG